MAAATKAAGFGAALAAGRHGRIGAMAPRIGIWLALLLCSAASAQISPTDLLKETVSDADHILAYGPDPLQFGELRLPKAKGPHPVAIVVHGGCYVDRLPGRDPRITTYALLRPLAAALTDAGIATWNVEYRRAGDSG